MKKLLLTFVGCLAIGVTSFSQTTIYSENFESGNTFTLNSSDLGAATTYNTWLMNNTFTGGSGTFTCLGFPFSFTVVNTPSQPGGITNSPSSNYMHIAAQAAVSSGINCASYIPADGTCALDESNFSKMTTPISTTGYAGVSFDFWWLCGGSAQAFGELYYSLDGGSTWTLKQSTLNNVSNWTQTTLTDAAWDNQASLLFAFRFVNTTTSTGADPAFSVDEIVVSGTTGGMSNAITTGTSLTPTSWCQGNPTTILVPFTSTGTFTAGNVYTAELSDATGSFAAPAAIGTLASTANSGSITAIVPGGTPAGTGYRIRVVSSAPATTGSDNGVDLVINALPAVTQQPFADVCLGGGTINLVGASPAGGAYSGSGVSGSSFDPTVPGVGTTNITYSYTDGNGCSGQAVEPITVVPSPTVTMAPFSDMCDTDPALTLTGGTPSGGTYSGPGVVGGIFSPSAAGVGVHTISYAFTDGNGCSGTAFETITVDDCSGINELNAIQFVVVPNPTATTFTIQSNVSFDSIELLDMSGRAVRNFDASKASHDVSNIPSGVYIIVLKADGLSGKQRLVIQ